MIDSKLASKLVFLPFPKGLDSESWGDWDSAEGMGGCDSIVTKLGRQEGLIVEKSRAGEWQELIDQAAEFFNEED